MTIEDAIRHHAKDGKLRLSVFPSSAGYQASMSNDGSAFRVEMAPDPAEALLKVLGLLPGAAGQPIDDTAEASASTVGVFD